MHDVELVREVEEQSVVNDERETEDLVGEVENQSTANYEEGTSKSTRRYLCWICGNRPFNARHQLVDHIDGAGVGGKSHLKMRKRWIESGQLMRVAWLAFLEKTNTIGNITSTDAAPSNTTVTHVAQAKQSIEVVTKVESQPTKFATCVPVEQQQVQHVQTHQAVCQHEWLPQNPWGQRAVQSPSQWLLFPLEARSECRRQLQSWDVGGGMSQPSKFNNDNVQQVPNGYCPWDHTWPLQ